MSGPRPIRPTSGGGAGLTPSQEGNLNANTAARHTHANKATLDATEEAFTTSILNNINQKVDSDGLKQLSTEDYTTAEKNKLGNITDSFKGFFADSTARDAAIITPASGFYVIQDDTDSVWFYDGAAWVNTGNTSTGDMLKAVYDPTSVSADAFSMGSMVETASEKVFTLAERTKLAGLIPIDQPTIDRIPAQEVVIGTGATEIPTNGDLPVFGTAATKDTGLASGQLPTADQLNMVGETINYTGANYQPSTALGIGVVRLMKNVSGSPLAQGQSVSASSLNRIYFNSSGTLIATASGMIGTWVAVTGGVAVNDTAEFLRIA